MDEAPTRTRQIRLPVATTVCLLAALASASPLTHAFQRLDGSAVLDAALLPVAWSANSEQPPAPLLRALAPVPREEPWWVQRHLAKTREARRGDARMIVIGDSLVHHFELRGLPLWNLYFGAYHPLNLGFAADLTEHALWRLRNGELDGLSPRLAVVMIGTNNTGLRRDPPAHTAAGIETIVHTLRERLPTTRVLLLGVFPRGRVPRNRARILNREVNEQLAAMTFGDCVYYVDIGEHFFDSDGALRRQVLYDFLHPTVRGYQIWAEAMGPAVRELMTPDDNAALPGFTDCQGS